jgi:PadR family transcriptional regulator PadR
MKDSGLFKGCLEAILLKLLQERGRMYGYEITREVKVLTEGGLTITEGALYPLLHRLEAEGVLSVEWEQVGSRMRKYYCLTPEGKEVSASAIKNLTSFMETMQKIISGPLQTQPS